MTTKETTELLVALVDLVKLLSFQLKDGLSFDDAVIIVKLVNDPKYKDAIVGLNQVIPELKDLSTDEVFDLVQAVLNEIKK